MRVNLLSRPLLLGLGLLAAMAAAGKPKGK
jgi:hypothetical protein